MFIKIIILLLLALLIGGSSSNVDEIVDDRVQSVATKDEEPANPCSDFYGHVCIQNGSDIHILRELKKIMIDKMRIILEEETDPTQTDPNLNNMRFLYRSCKSEMNPQDTKPTTTPTPTPTPTTTTTTTKRPKTRKTRTTTTLIPEQTLTTTISEIRQTNEYRERSQTYSVKYNRRAIEVIRGFPSFQAALEDEDFLDHHNCGGEGRSGFNPQTMPVWLYLIQDLDNNGFGSDALLKVNWDRTKHSKINFTQQNFIELKTKLKDNQEEIAYLLNEFGETDDSKEISLIREYISKVDSRKILKYDTLLEEFDEHVAFKRSAENYPKTDVYPCLDSFSRNVNVHEAFDNLIKYPTSKPVLVDKENMRNFLQLLETNKRTIGNVIVLNAIAKLDSEFIYDNQVNCVVGTARLMKFPMLVELTRVIGEQGVIDEVNKLAYQVKNQYIKLVESAKWLSIGIKDQIIAEINNVKLEYGCPSELLDGSIISDIYDGLKMNESDFVSNVLNARIANNRFDKRGLKLGQKSWLEVLSLEFEVMRPKSAYSAALNSIYIHPMYLDSLTMSSDDISYPLIGAVVGRELTNIIELKAATLREFSNGYDRKSECIKSHRKCEDSLRDDLLDHFGFMAAYDTFVNNQSLAEDDKSDERKKFWKGLARHYCTDEYQRWCSTSNRRRINLSLQNYQEFSTDFDCSPHSIMNRRNKCTVW